MVDGVTSKTAKFAIGVLFHWQERYLADAECGDRMHTTYKNAVGISMVIGIAVICILPI